MAVITPITREEFYLAKAGGQDVPVPSAVTREEHYLEKLSNDNVAVPSPVTRREKFLYFACGGEIDLPSEGKMTRLERLIAKAGGMDISTPTAVTRLEKFWANVEGGGWKTITGVLPLTFTAKGDNVSDWVIEGNDDNGTENLWNENYENISIHATYKPIYVGNGSFTLSTNAPLSDGAALLFLMPGQQSSGGTTARDGVYDGSPRTVTSVDGYVTLIYRIYGNEDPRDYQTMLVKGSTAPDHYIPYQQGVGERTAQLFPDTVGKQVITVAAGTNLSAAISGSMTLAAGRYTIHYYQSTLMTSNTRNTLSFLIVGTSTQIYESAATNHNLDAGWYSWTFDIPNDGSYQMRIWIVDASDEVKVTNFILTKGETATPTEYIPYGYQIPLTISQQGQPDKTVDIFIGDSPLTSGDYVDYESGKIYKAKRIHEDTVTIDGIVWDILDYDHDEVYKADGTRAKHTVTIQTHDIIDNLQYSARQAAFAFPNGLTAGTYHFTVGAHPWVAGDVNKVLTFTLVNAIPTGGQLVFNGAYNQTLVGTTISVFASPTDTTAAETVTMTEGSDGTDLGTILRSKTDTINSIDRALLGSNNWLESALRQYLNSDKAAGNAWTPQTVFDRPPTLATTTAGFINGKSPSFISHIGTAKKTTALSTVTDGGGNVESDERFFLLSSPEVYGENEVASGEGAAYSYYADYSDLSGAGTGADTNRIKYRNNTVYYWWMRSPDVTYAGIVHCVATTGEVYNFFAYDSYGVAPACCIVLDDMDDWVKQTFYTEVDADLPTIELFEGENTVSTTLYNKPEVEIKYK